MKSPVKNSGVEFGFNGMIPPSYQFKPFEKRRTLAKISASRMPALELP